MYNFITTNDVYCIEYQNTAWCTQPEYHKREKHKCSINATTIFLWYATITIPMSNKNNIRTAMNQRFNQWSSNNPHISHCSKSMFVTHGSWGILHSPHCLGKGQMPKSERDMCKSRCPNCRDPLQSITASRGRPNSLRTDVEHPWLFRAAVNDGEYADVQTDLDETSMRIWGVTFHESFQYIPGVLPNHALKKMWNLSFWVGLCTVLLRYWATPLGWVVVTLLVIYIHKWWRAIYRSW